MILWIPIAALIGQNLPMQGLSAENTNLIMSMLLLIPIGLVSLPLTYTLDFTNYPPGRNKALSISKRIFFSLFTTGIVLVFSWHLFIFLSVMLYFRFNA